MSSELRVDKIVPVNGVPTGGGGGVIQTIMGSTTNIQAPAASSRALGISVFPSGFYNAESASTPTVVNFAGLVDSPSTTSAITYTFQVNSTQNASQTFYYNRTVNDTDAIDFERGLSWITAMEIAA